MTVHPYFTEKARLAFSKASGDPDNAGPLAEWAEQAKALGRAAPHGVLVAEDGQILAETFLARGRVSAVHVDDEGTKRWRLFGNEVGLAVGQISRQVGQPVIHVPLSVFTGASKRTWTGDECAAHCGIKPSTWRDYVADGRAPRPLDGFGEDRKRRWLAKAVREWQSTRPGKGARTDLRGRT